MSIEIKSLPIATKKLLSMLTEVVQNYDSYDERVTDICLQWLDDLEKELTEKTGPGSDMARDDIKNATCGDCWYWTNMKNGMQVGSCKRYPPAPQPEHAGSDYYPQTDVNMDACGEFRRQT